MSGLTEQGATFVTNPYETCQQKPLVERSDLAAANIDNSGFKRYARMPDEPTICEGNVSFAARCGHE